MLIIQDVDEAYNYLKLKANQLPDEFRELAFVPLTTPDFLDFPASTRKHQVYKGGLVVHTAQVLYGMLQLLNVVKDAKIHHATIAAIWHDFAKIIVSPWFASFRFEGMTFGVKRDGLYDYTASLSLRVQKVVYGFHEPYWEPIYSLEDVYDWLRRDKKYGIKVLDE